MGVFKKKIRNCPVNSLSDVKMLAERCLDGDEAKLNPERMIQAILVGDDEETIQVPLYNWQTKFALFQKLNTNILVANNHFEMNIELPGFVLCRNGLDTEIVSYNLLSNKNMALLDQEMPAKLLLEPLSSERRHYLYTNVREYFTTEEAKNSKLWNSMAGTEVADLKRKSPNDIQFGKRTKRSLPTCGYCKLVGHRETAFGKVRCPKKKKDCSILETSTHSFPPEPDSVIDIAASAIVDDDDDDSIDSLIGINELESEGQPNATDSQHQLSDYNLLVEDISATDKQQDT